MPSDAAPVADLAQAEARERSRRRKLLWLTLALLVGLPIYLLVAASLVAAVNPPAVSGDGRTLHWVIELLIYLALGTVWAWPLKRLSQGLGRKR